MNDALVRRERFMYTNRELIALPIGERRRASAVIFDYGYRTWKTGTAQRFPYVSLFFLARGATRKRRSAVM